MADYDWARMRRGALADAFIWFSAPAIFLYFYVSRFGAPASAIGPHLRYVAVGLFALLWLRALLAWAVPGKNLARALTTLAISSAVITLLFYYFLVIVGLNSWNRVVSWSLVSGYLPHLAELAATLEISLLAAGLTCALLWLPLFACVWLYLKKYDWITSAVQASRARMIVLYLAFGCAVIALQVFNFLNWPDARRFEPFAMTVFPEQTVARLAENQVDQLRAAALDRLEDQARASYRPNPEANKRNVILIVVDALRADHLGLYGYERDTTPFLSRLAQGGQVQKVADLRASCAETVCGLLSLYSSKFVTQFSERPLTLQEVLRRHGYAIHVVLGGDHTNFYGMTKIYRDVDSFFDGSMAQGVYPNDDRFVTGKAEALPEWDARPVLLQYHLMSAHGLGKRNAGNGHYAPAKNYVGTPNAYTAEAGTVTPSTRNHYDNGVVQTDYTIEKILASLERKGYLSNALVAITADHGESLGEHGLFTHANGVHEPLLHIPFIMISYGARAAPFPDGLANASQVDIAPTLLAELGMPIPATWSGVPLRKGSVNALSFFDQANWHGLVDQRDSRRVWKYWTDATTHAEYAFDLGTDPHELRNLIGSVDPALKNSWRRKVLSSAR
jgi:glucan phosphoethanolaminetransferase (alkaline phosphatase superfamily)